MSYSDYDKFKDKNKKKKIFFNKEREENNLPSGRQTIILAKPERDKDVDRDRVERSQTEGQAGPSKSTQPQQTTFILKTRDSDSRAVSPSQKTPVVLRKESDVVQPSYQIATKPTPAEASAPTPTANLLQLPPTMNHCMKLVDDSMQICDGVLEYLADQNDFTVVGIIGEPGVGKSYVMSALAARPGVFKSQVKESAEGSGHCTYGIDIYVTPSRLLLLDTQPVLSSVLAERCCSMQDKKFTGEFQPNELSCEMLSLQMSAFLLSVCHVVIIIQDWIEDSNLISCLLDAEMLKPSTPTTSDDVLVEYFPHVVFVRNKSPPSDFTPASIARMQNYVKETTLGSQLHMESGISISNGQVIPHLTPASCGGTKGGGSLNIFVLPNDDDKDKSDKYRGHIGFEALCRALRHQILSASHQPLTPTPISEKHWFHYASKTLENVKKSSLFMEFGRFLP